MLSASLSPLAAFQQWIVYKLVPSKSSPGKMDKLPINLNTMNVHNPHDPNIWVNADTAVNMANMMGDEYGFGFVFTLNDPFFFVDIDDCVIDGEWNDIAKWMMENFQGCAVEVSQSGKGLHIFGSYSGKVEHSCKNQAFGLECYTEARFVALTDNILIEGDAGLDHSVGLQNAVTHYFPPTDKVQRTKDWRDVAVDGWSGPDDDDILINKMLASKSAGAAFGGKASIRDLWNADDDVLSKFYPSQNDVDPYDRSSADYALAMHLAFWTGKNHERMKTLMNKSGLVRDKWEKNKRYLSERTIGGAVDSTKEVYNDGKANKKQRDYEPVADPKADVTHHELNFTQGDQFMTISQQAEFFAGCVYVQSEHKVFVPSGHLLKSEQFKATYGGYIFSKDHLNEKVTTNAWEVFTESQAIRFPKVNGLCFRPDLESGDIVESDGEKLVNTYIPIDIPSVAGDATPFLDHIGKLITDDRDQTIILSWMAAAIQYPGKKFRWAPLIQGVEGNGKSLIAKVMAYCVGERYVHYPNASDFGGNTSKFTGWLQRTRLAVLEEVYTNDRREVTEPLKVMISNDRMEIQKKGVDQFTAAVVAIYMLFSNFKDAINVSFDTRRYAIFYCAQQSKQDKIRDGITSQYFVDLFDWLDGGGYAICHNFLANFKIPDELNPARSCQDAPTTSSTAEAVHLSLGTVEQEILEAIDGGRPGFVSPWVSSTALDRLLIEKKLDKRVPLNKRREMMEKLGYIWHPHLKEGRVNNVIPGEGTKPKLFVKDGHLAAQLQSAEIVANYIERQGFTAPAMPGSKHHG